MPVALVEGPSVLWRVGRRPGVFEWRLPKDRELLPSDERPRQFDRGVVMSQDRRVTRQIAGFLREYADSDLHDQGPIAGLRYESRIAAEQTCWAIWQDRLQLSDEQTRTLTSEDPDLLEAAELLDLEITAVKTHSSPGE